MSWILSASRSGARILDKQGDDISLVESFTHDQGRLRDGEINSDRHGRSFSRTTDARHALETSEAPRDHEAKAFARALAEKLRQARLAGRFERLVLVSEPRFLGFVREALDDVTARLVIASVPKDLQQLPVAEIAAHLPDLPQRVL